MVDSTKQPGRLRPAPENFLTEDQVTAVGAGRRDFLRKSFLAAGAALAAPLAARASEGDPDILGTIAGENTVLLICRSEAARERVARRLLALAGR